MSTYWKYKRGSEWRKWDFHIHTKGTRKNDQFDSPDFDSFCKLFFQKALENEIEAIGVTDYFSIENYLKVKDYVLKIEDNTDFDEQEKSKIKEIFLFPNVELRMLPSTEKSRLVNIHCIFNPDYVSSLENNFFGSIEHSGGNGRKYKMNTQGMIDLGKSLDDSLEGNSAYDKGIGSFVVTHQSLQDLLDTNHEFRDNTIVAVSNSNKDGASAFSKHYDLFENEAASSLDGIRQAIYHISDCILSSNEKDRDFFTGKKADSVESVIKKCGSLKACIHGSDAHSNDKLFKPDNDRYCWVKSDLTFEGLRQIVFEPSDRVRVQTLKPDVKAERHLISEIQFQSSDYLFGNQSILLNDNLNSIIGGKSSGKSLLLHSIAQSIDPEQVDRIANRLKFDGYKFEGESFDFKVKWKNGEQDTLSNLNPDDKSKKITYIPQLYINYLAEKNNKEELNALIGNILLQDEKYKEFFESKEELISQLTQFLETELANLLSIRSSAIELNRKIKETGTSKAIDKAIKQFEKQIQEGQKLSNLSPEEIKSYNDLIKEKERIEKEQRLLNSKTSTLEKFKQELVKSKFQLVGSKASEQQVAQKGQLDRILDELTAIPEDIQNIKNEVANDFETILSNLEKRISTLELKDKIEKTSKELETVTKSLVPFLKKLTGQRELKKLTENLEKEKLKKVQSEKLEKLFENSVTDYKNSKSKIYDSLKARINAYKEIVSKINETKNDIGEEITLDCSLICKKENFILFEQANKTSISQDHFFNNLFNEDVVYYDKIPELFSSTKKVQDEKLLLSEDRTIPLRQKVTLDDVLKGLISNSLELDYKVTYKNDELLHMSPGKKGTVLLILFLQISSAEHPILIDQPEDNLDNRTIYDLLCTIIKDKKKERQILIVSHNANLVVATDSENIIVANQEGQDPQKEKSQHRFEYINGGLEYSFVKNEAIQGILYQQGIKEHVCDILEGGNEAFKQRERKYDIK